MESQSLLNVLARVSLGIEKGSCANSLRAVSKHRKITEGTFGQ